ncbi:MAG: hypothetical protein ACPHID_06920 [Thermoplasmatota archaeon]
MRRTWRYAKHAIAPALIILATVGVWLASPVLVRHQLYSSPSYGDNAIVEQAIAISVHLMGTLLSIMVVYVVFKLTHVFQRLEEAKRQDLSSVEDIREDRAARDQFVQLLEVRDEYIQPLVAPVVAMLSLIAAELLLHPFAIPIATDAARALSCALTIHILTIGALSWTLWTAFNGAIER